MDRPRTGALPSPSPWSGDTAVEGAGTVDTTGLPTGEVRLTSATLWYLGNTTSAPVAGGAPGKPLLANVLCTPLGLAGQFVLPLTYREMLRDRPRLVDLAGRAIESAHRLGARHVSLSGMLAAALRYGQVVEDPPCPVTTGHAATAVSVLRAVEHILATCARSWATEHVALVGVGSVGQATARAAVDQLGTPRRLTLVDLPGSRARVQAVVDDLREVHPGLDVEFSPADTAPTGPLAEATTVVGASGVPDVLQVSRLRPGVVVVDDSVPNCFDVAAARRRASAAGDLVFTNGGYMSFPSSYPVVRVRHDDSGRPRLDPGCATVTTEIASCILAPLLMAHDPTLPPTTGPGAPPAVVRAFGAGAARLWLAAGPITCKGRAPRPGYLEVFAERFGGVPR